MYFRNHSPWFCLHLFTTYVRPLLEVNTVIWSLSHVFLKNMIEDAQKKFSRRLCPHLTYIDHLKNVGLKSLEERRIMFDLYEFVSCYSYAKLS